jgi:mono/diheme cytochrome c family protein
VNRRARHLAPILIAFGSLFVAVSAAWAQQGGDPQRGGQLFAENCAVCHGVDGQGRVGASLESFPGIDPGAAIETTVTNGIPGSVMPAWGQANGGPLSEQDIRDIAAYIVTAFEGTEPLTPLPTYVAPAIPALPNVEGDPSQGSVVFQENCVPCHGDRGQGRFGVPLAKAWPSNDPDVYIQQVVRTGIAGSVMPAWAQVNGGPLTDKQIADVAAFVLTLEPLAQPTAIPEPPSGMTTSATLILLGLLAVGAVIVLVVYYRNAKPG